MLNARLIAWMAGVLFFTQAAAAFAVPKAFLGSWHGNMEVTRIPSISFDFTFFPAGTFLEHANMTGGRQFTASGTYVTNGTKAIALKITRICMVNCRVLPHPSSVNYQVKSLSSSTIVLREKKYGGVVVLRRPARAAAQKNPAQ